MSTNGHTCDDFTDHLAELALGTLSGRERAETLAHVDSCGRCSAEVEELSRVADELLHVAPETEPPLGFEVRLLERLGVNPALHPARSSRRRRLDALGRHGRAVLLGAAAASVAALGTGIGLAVTSGPPAPSRASAVAQATLVDAHGQDVGRVVASPGEPAWVLMFIEANHLSGPVTCELVLAGGRTVKVGTFWVKAGYGTWSAPIDVPVSEVRGARLVSSTGSVVATATFPA